VDADNDNAFLPCSLPFTLNTEKVLSLFAVSFHFDNVVSPDFVMKLNSTLMHALVIKPAANEGIFVDKSVH